MPEDLLRTVQMTDTELQAAMDLLEKKHGIASHDGDLFITLDGIPQRTLCLMPDAVVIRYRGHINGWPLHTPVSAGSELLMGQGWVTIDMGETPIEAQARHTADLP